MARRLLLLWNLIALISGSRRLFVCATSERPLKGFRSNRAFLIVVMSWDSCKSRISTPVNFERANLFVGDPGVGFGVSFSKDLTVSAKDLPRIIVGTGVSPTFNPPTHTPDRRYFVQLLDNFM